MKDKLVNNNLGDINNLEDIKTFVNAFYLKVQDDELLSPVFALRIAPDAWSKHLNRMYGFWNTVLFFQRSYKGNPFARHLDLPIEPVHFERWTQLFKATIDEHFKGDVADEAKRRVDKMAVLFMNKITFIRNNPSFTPIM